MITLTQVYTVEMTIRKIRKKVIYTDSTQRLIFIHTRRESKSTLAGLFSVLLLCTFGVKVIIHANFLWYYSYQD